MLSNRNMPYFLSFVFFAFFIAYNYENNKFWMVNDAFVSGTFCTNQ